ncbi:MAG: aminoglycoside phosphotransferase family protein [Blastocatellia bacterium]
MTAQISTGNSSGALTGDLSEKRVRAYAARHFGVHVDDIQLTALTPDASTRKYYRVAASATPGRTFIISLYASPFNPQDNTYLDVTRLFERAGLPVPQIIDVAGTEGIILQEDLTDCSLNRWLQDAEARGDHAGARAMLHEAIELIARIQAASELAVSTDSCAGKLAFDEDKLGWELNYFFDHFFGSYRKQNFPAARREAIQQDLRSVAAELAARPRVLTHRDYHAMNLMVDQQGQLRIIDHQDARMGPATYDLVPILVERRLAPADEQWIESEQAFFLAARKKHGLPVVPAGEFQREFQLMTVQRQLKATGTFSYQTAVMGRPEVYEKYIRPAVATVLRAMKKPGMKSYPALRGVLESL